MIGSSRRRSALGRAQSAPTFELHVREARSADVHRRLLHLAVAALVAAVVVLFLPLSTPLRAAIVAGAALVGALIPTRNTLAATLKSIRDQTGLSYETAIQVSQEQAGQPAENDPYGFKSAVLERAALSTRGYLSPPRPAWWLPAMIVAVALVLLPQLLPGLGGGGWSSPTAQPPQGGVNGPAGVEQPLQPDPEPPEPPSGAQAEDPFASQRPDDQAGDNPVTDLPEGDMGGEAPLSRFLQSLRERPATGDGAPTEGPTSEGDPDSQRSDSDPDEQPGDGAGDRTGDQSNDPTTGSDLGEDDRSSTSDTGQQQDQEGQEEAGGDDGSGAGAEDEEGEMGLQQGNDQPDQGSDAGGQGEDSGQQGLQAGGDEDGAGAEAADSAGEGGAEAAPGSMDREEVSGSADMLFGVLQDGPENVAGSVRLPGSTDVELPAGRSFSSYQSAAEEALSESDLPLDYQEIIRRYFQ